MQNTELTFHEKTALGFAQKAATAKTIEDGAWFMRAANRHADKAGLTLEEIEDKAEAIEAAKAETKVAVAPAQKRCPHYKQIRAFFAAARDMGLDISEQGKDRARGAISMLLGRRIESRSELNAQEWEHCTNAVNMGVLLW